LENGFQQQEEEQLEWLFGTRLPGPKTIPVGVKVGVARGDMKRLMTLQGGE